MNGNQNSSSIRTVIQMGLWKDMDKVLTSDLLNYTPESPTCLYGRQHLEGLVKGHTVNIY